MQKDTGSLKNLKSQKVIIAALKTNDETTLKEVYQNNYFKIERFVLSNNGSEEQAKDLYQDAFIAMWRNLKDEKFVPQNETALEGYLYQIAKNKWLDYLRSAYHRKTVLMKQSIDVNPQVEDPAPVMDEEGDRVNQALKAFEGLKEGCKKLLSHFYFEKRPLKEIAKELSLDPASVKNKKYRCMQELRALAQKK